MHPVSRAMTWWATRFLLPSVVLLLGSGCYTIQTAQREALEPLARTHDDHIALSGPRAGTRVDPTSPVRFHFNDGGHSSWLLPSLLEVNASGVFTTRHGLSIDDLARIEVRALIDTRRALLLTLSEGLLVHDEPDRFEVTGPGAALRAWAEAVRSAGVALPEEEWVFFWRGSEPMRELRFEGLTFQRALTLTDGFVDGAHWSDIASLEVQHPDYGSVVLGLALVPIALAGGGGASLSGLFERGGGRLPVVESLTDETALHLWRPGRAVPDARGAKPLFSELAQRRALIRPIAAVEVGASFTGLASQLAVFGGVRLRDWFEVGLGVQAWWPNLFSPTRSLSTAPLGPVVSKYSPTVFTTLRVGFNFDLDADRRVLVPLHLMVGFDFQGQTQTRIAWGLQVRITQHLFVALRPLTPQYTSGAHGINTWQFPSTLEVGATF